MEYNLDRFDRNYYLQQEEFSGTEKYYHEMDCIRVEIQSILTDRQVFDVTDSEDYSILDVGTGTGRFINYLNDSDQFNCFSATGVDYPESWWKSIGWCNLSMVRMIYPDKLPFNDGRFDAVTFIHSIGHVPNPDKLLKEAYRVLGSSGGVVGIVTPNKNFVRLYKPLNRLGIVNYEPDMTVVNLFSKVNLESLLSSAGFDMIKVYYRGYQPSHPLLRMFSNSRWKERIMAFGVRYPS